MKVLVGCECSGVVRRAFRALGHDAWSCDLQASDDGSEFHFQCDLCAQIGDGWDMLIAHPDCTYLANSSVGRLHHIPPNPGKGKIYGEARWHAMREGAEFFKTLLECAIPRVCIENPVMHGHALTIVGRSHSQTIQPFNFGDDASKRTCLWLRGIPKLKPTCYIEPRLVNGKPRWANQTDSGQNKLTPSADRAKLRSETYPGIAAAMAEQWSN